MSLLNKSTKHMVSYIAGVSCVFNFFWVLVADGLQDLFGGIDAAFEEAAHFVEQATLKHPLDALVDARVQGFPIPVQDDDVERERRRFLIFVIG